MMAQKVLALVCVFLVAQVVAYFLFVRAISVALRHSPSLRKMLRDALDLFESQDTNLVERQKAMRESYERTRAEMDRKER